MKQDELLLRSSAVLVYLQNRGKTVCWLVEIKNNNDDNNDNDNINNCSNNC